MPRIARCLFVAFATMAMSAAAIAAANGDNFSDNSQSNQWSLIEDDHAALWLSETNQRLELRAAGGGASTNDALYLSSGAGGFKLGTASDLSASIDYRFAYSAGAGDSGTLAIVFGIGRDLAGTDSAAIGYSRSTNFLLDHAVGVAYRVGGDQKTVAMGWDVATSGTFTLSYTAASDRLTFGNGTFSTNLDGLVQGQWHADTVWLSFGGRGSGLTAGSGDAYLDNFSVTGDIIAAPEPATLALLAFGGLGLVARRRKQHAR